MLLSSLLRIASLAVLACGLLPSEVQAGPLINWLFGRPQPPAYAVGQPVPVASANAYAMGPNVYPNNGYNSPAYSTGYGAYPSAGMPSGVVPTGYAANYGAYYGPSLPVIGPAGAGYQSQMPSGISATTMPGVAPATAPPTFSYVPNFNSYNNRAAVTYYRPMLTTDPKTGAQVVVMAPCTSYEYQTQRVPTVGRSALFAPAVPAFPQPVAPAYPTYTLPSGGIPIANTAPSVMQPTVSGFGTYPSTQPYSAMQTPTYGPVGTYPTTSAGPNACVNGSCNTLQTPSMPVPGLVAPQAPTTSLPSNSYPAPTYPPPSYPAPNGSGVFPPSTDPAADTIPTLPPSFPASAGTESHLRPKLQSIVRQPLANDSGKSDSSVSAPRPQPSSQSDPSSLMTPIPVPQGFDDSPRWNPGLLQDGDKTASRNAAERSAVLAGESKRIHWASFEQSSPRSSDLQSELKRSPNSDSSQFSSSLRMEASESQALGTHNNSLHLESPTPSSTAPRTGLRMITPTPPSTHPANSGQRKYESGGWEVAR